MVGAYGEPDDMRHHQTHETNAAAQRDEHPCGQRGDDESEPPQAVAFDAERGGRLLAETENVGGLTRCSGRLRLRISVDFRNTGLSSVRKQF